MTEEQAERFQDDREFNLLIEEVIKLKPQTILEIGSLFGGTLKEWMKLLPEGGTLISIDKLVEQVDPRYALQLDMHRVGWHVWAAEKKIQFTLFEDSSWDPFIVNDLKRKNIEIDFLFIDGDHTFEGVSKDYELYSPLVRKGGIIAFHDISFEKGSIYYGVKPLWEELKKKFPFKEFTFRDQLYGIGVLYV